jgi:hypothetical protein
MLRRRPKNLPRLAGDNPLLRAAFARSWDMHPRFLRGRLSLGVHEQYAAWLQSKGIEPTTGKMTEQGVAFFKTLIEEQNALNRVKRAHRQAA